MVKEVPIVQRLEDERLGTQYRQSVVHTCLFPTLSSMLQFPDPDEAQAVLQDVLAFIDNCQEEKPQILSPASGKSQKTKNYSPDYERRRRERKKKEREALRMQLNQYETQLELLKLQTSTLNCGNEKWGWVALATQEEDKRRKAEELNTKLRGMLAQQFHTAETIRRLLAQEEGLAERVQSVMAPSTPNALLKSPDTFPTIRAIAMHLKGMFGRLRDAAGFVFSAPSFSLGDENSMGSVMCAANIKCHDPLSKTCIETLSMTPLSCNSQTAASMLWKMLINKEVFGPSPGRYAIKAKDLTQSTAEFGYSVNVGTDNAKQHFDGATLIERVDEESRTVFVWTSLMVEPDGKPNFRSQGWISVTKLPSNPNAECIVRMCSRISGKQFGIPCDSAEVDFAVARKSQLLGKSRQERIQLRIINHAEVENSS